MNGDQKGVPCEPDKPHDPNDVYGGRWAPGEVPEDRSGRGSAPRPPGAPITTQAEPQSFTPEPDEAGAGARTHTPRTKPAKTPKGKR
jgi:hypothetical protein